MNDEFYIGYQKTAPPSTARLIAIAVIALLFTVAAVALAVGSSQNPSGDGTYAFGKVESFEGVLLPLPVPHLLINDEDEIRRALLVDRGKHGLPRYTHEAFGDRVRLSATRIERHGILMLELAGPKQFEVLSDNSVGVESANATKSVTIIGDLVDTKCYLGVMNPGEGKVHRGCAAECLRGGVQPGLLVRAADGTRSLIFIAADPGEINPEWAARRIEISGRLSYTGELETIDAEQVRLLPIAMTK